MATQTKSPAITEFTAPSADEAIEQMFGYFTRDQHDPAKAANTNRSRVVSELDAAGAILSAKRFG